MNNISLFLEGSILNECAHQAEPGKGGCCCVDLHIVKYVSDTGLKYIEQKRRTMNGLLRSSSPSGTCTMWCFLIGTRGRTVRLKITINTKKIKARILTVHLKPTSFSKRRSAIGRMVPPTLEPKARTPYARPLRLSNHVGTTESEGRNTNPELMPSANPWHRIN